MEETKGELLKLRAEDGAQNLQNGASDAEKPKQSSNLKGDRLKIALLILLYTTTQMITYFGIAIPVVLQDRGATYKDQAGFSLVNYPMILRTLWAPIVDCIYSSKFGRRKTWLVPSQFLLGILLLVISMNIDDWIGRNNNSTPNIRMLTLMFLLCQIVAGTQDVAVDGWSITMLQRKNVGYSGTCKIIGSSLGSLVGYVLFIVLDSKTFCNEWLRTVPQNNGIISFPAYMFFWSMVCMISSIFVMLFKKDNSIDIMKNKKDVIKGIQKGYLSFWKILNIRPVQIVCLLVLTAWIGFGPITSVTSLKLIDAGIPRYWVALFFAPLIPILIILPFVLKGFLVGPKSLKCFLLVFASRLSVCLLLPSLLYFLTLYKVNGKINNENVPWWYYILLMIGFGLDQLGQFIMYVALYAFYARISDPRFGGTYLSLLNTVTNFGSRSVPTLALFLVDILTWKTCKPGCTSTGTNTDRTYQCCETIVDGYYVEIVFGIIFSILWLLYAKRKFIKLQNLDRAAWLVEKDPYFETF